MPRGNHYFMPEHVCISHTVAINVNFCRGATGYQGNS